MIARIVRGKPLDLRRCKEIAIHTNLAQAEGSSSMEQRSTMLFLPCQAYTSPQGTFVLAPAAMRRGFSHK